MDLENITGQQQKQILPKWVVRQRAKRQFKGDLLMMTIKMTDFDGVASADSSVC